MSAAAATAAVVIVDLGEDVEVKVDVYRGALPLLVITAGALEIQLGVGGHRDQIKALDAVVDGVLRLRDELHRALR